MSQRQRQQCDLSCLGQLPAVKHSIGIRKVGRGRHHSIWVQRKNEWHREDSPDAMEAMEILIKGQTDLFSIQ